MRINMKGELLRVPEAARRLGLKSSTLRAWILQRKIAYCKLNGGAIRIPSDEIERLIGDSYISVASGGEMTSSSYFSGAAELKPEIPDDAPAHLVEELLAVIELWRGSIPSAGQCEAMQRLAHSIREES